MQTNDKHIPETVDQIHLYSWASKCVCGCSAYSRDHSWFLAVYYIDCSETSDHPHVCVHVFVLHWCSSALWTRRISFRLVCCLRYHSFTLSCTSEIQLLVWIGRTKGGTSWDSPKSSSWRFMGLSSIYWSHTDLTASASHTWPWLFSYFFSKAHPISKISVFCPAYSFFSHPTLMMFGLINISIAF